MIRPITCVCVLLACGSGLYLYQAKHRVQMIDREIEKTVHATDELREQTRVLHAEWTLQNDPQRLQTLAEQFLNLKTVTPGQFTNLAELDSRLPEVRAPEPPPSEAQPLPVAEAPPPEPPPAAVPPAPPPRPAVVAAAAAAAAPSAGAQAAAASRASPRRSRCVRRRSLRVPRKPRCRRDRSSQRRCPRRCRWAAPHSAWREAPRCRRPGRCRSMPRNG